MHLHAKSVAAWIALGLLLTGAARAMTVTDFKHLNDDDESGFVAFLVEASAQMLQSKGQAAQADKVIAYFSQPGKDGGVQQFSAHLKEVDAINKRNAIKPNNTTPELQIEDAMSLTLRDIGIAVPPKYLESRSKEFKAAGLPRQRAKDD